MAQLLAYTCVRAALVSILPSRSVCCYIPVAWWGLPWWASSPLAPCAASGSAAAAGWPPSSPGTKRNSWGECNENAVHVIILFSSLFFFLWLIFFSILKAEWDVMKLIEKEEKKRKWPKRKTCMNCRTHKSPLIRIPQPTSSRFQECAHVKILAMFSQLRKDTVHR